MFGAVVNVTRRYVSLGLRDFEVERPKQEKGVEKRNIKKRGRERKEGLLKRKSMSVGKEKYTLDKYNVTILGAR